MKFKIVHCSEIDSFKWNSRIESQKSEIYNEYHYLSACTLDNWYGFVWGDYDCVLPFYQKKKWGIIPYVCMPPFCQKFDNRNLTEQMFQEVLGYFKKNFWLVDYQVSEAFKLDGFGERKNYILKRDVANYDEIALNYSSLLKKNLAKAKLSVIKLDDWTEILAFLAKNDTFGSQITQKQYKAFERLIANSQIKLLRSGIAIEGKLEAILIAPLYQNHAYLLFPFSSKAAKKAQAMSVLIDELIQDNQIQSINFEGSSIDSIARFYEQFGAELEIYWSMNWEKYDFLRILG